MANVANAEAQKQILFASRHAYMYYQSVSDAFQDYSLSFTQNAKQAINYLKKNKPSVVILGENLKELDTLKLSKAIRKSSRLTATKIMLLIPDNRDISDIDEERKKTIDIILKQSQKPASFVTHIAKLLKASEAIQDSLNSNMYDNSISLDKDEAKPQNNRSSNEVQPSAHPTPFPEAAEHIYLLPEDENVNATTQTIEASQSPQLQTPQNCEETNNFSSETNYRNQSSSQMPKASNSEVNITSNTLAPIRPPHAPSNKPVYQQEEYSRMQQASIPQANVQDIYQTVPQAQPTAQVTTNNIQSDMPANIISYPTIESSNQQATASTSEEKPALMIEGLLDSSDEEISQNFQSSHTYDNMYESENSATKTIAIIEDNASIAFLEKSILERQGYNTIQISDAPQAREFVDTNFDMADLILLDLNLPGGSGFEILRRIRSFSRKPVIIVSGLKQSENIKRGLSLGAQDYLTKPMNPQELILRVSQHIKNFT